MFPPAPIETEVGDVALYDVLNLKFHLKSPSDIAAAWVVAVKRADRKVTAFAHRDVEYSFLSAGVCADPADADKSVRWGRGFWAAMQPYSTGGVYVNYLGREADEGCERIKAAYGPEKYARLVALKNKYDPGNLFRLNQNIEPSQAAVRSA